MVSDSVNETLLSRRATERRSRSLFKIWFLEGCVCETVFLEKLEQTVHPSKVGLRQCVESSSISKVLFGNRNTLKHVSKQAK